jgi:hypothetical protein
MRAHDPGTHRHKQACTLLRPMTEPLQSGRSSQVVLSDKLEPVSVFADEQASGRNQLAPFEKSGVA